MLPSGSLAFMMLTASIPLLVDFYERRYREQDKLATFEKHPPNVNLPVKETFDYIIGKFLMSFQKDLAVVVLEMEY